MELPLQILRLTIRRAPRLARRVELIKPSTDLRNTIIYVDQWDERVADEPNALHFCSRECQHSYLAQ